MRRRTRRDGRSSSRVVARVAAWRRIVARRRPPVVARHLRRPRWEADSDLLRAVLPFVPIMPAGGKQIFVAYSRSDVDLVRPVVELMRVGDPNVFLDLDSIRVGKRWQQERNQAIKKSNLVVVFWCLHSKASVEVRVEYNAAIRQKKEIRSSTTRLNKTSKVTGCLRVDRFPWCGTRDSWPRGTPLQRVLRQNTPLALVRPQPEA